MGSKDDLIMSESENVEMYEDWCVDFKKMINEKKRCARLHLFLAFVFFATARWKTTKSKNP
jgi:hypothetical protein